MLFDRAAVDPGLLFAEDFDPPDSPAPPSPEAEPEIPALTWADVEAARSQGRVAGLAEAASRDAARAAEALATIGTELAATRDALVASAEQAALSVATVLMEAVAAVLPDLCAKHGEREAAAVLRMVLPALSHESEIVVRVHPAIVPPIQREIDTLTEDFAAQVTLLPVASMAPGDVQIRWQDARVVRDTAGLCAAIIAALVPAEVRQGGTAGNVTPNDKPANDAPAAVPARREVMHVD